MTALQWLLLTLVLLAVLLVVTAVRGVDHLRRVVEDGEKQRVCLLRLSQFVERFEEKFDKLSKALVPSPSEEYEVGVVLTGSSRRDESPERTHDAAGHLNHYARAEVFQERTSMGHDEVRDFPITVFRPTDLLYVEVHGPGTIINVKIDGNVALNGPAHCKRLSLLGWKMDSWSACVVTVKFTPPKRRLAD